MCPRCNKGYHWAKDCKSKYADGRPLNKTGGNLQPHPQEGTISCVQWENSWSSGFDLLVLEALTLSPDNTPVPVTCRFHNSVKELTELFMGNEKYHLQGLTVHPYYTILQSKSPTIVYVSSSRQWLGLKKNAKIAIFFPLPSETSPQIYWTQPILDQRPLATIYIREIAFGGLTIWGTPTTPTGAIIQWSNKMIKMLFTHNTSPRTITPYIQKVIYLIMRGRQRCK
jgi:hypothetical protein